MFIKIIVIHQLRTFINMRTIEHLRLSISFFFSHISLYLFRSFSFLAHCFFHVSLPPCIFLTDPFLITLFLSLSHFPFDSRPILFSLSRFHLYWIYFLFVCLSFLSSLFSSIYLSRTSRAFSSLPLSFFFFVLSLLQEIVKPETSKIKVEFRLPRIKIKTFTCPKIGSIIVRNSREVTQYLSSK